jgi:hypothetical protein
MKKLITIILLGLFGFAATAQTSYNRYDDRHYYDEEFDWHWDVRVRITNGIESGLITNWESKRLYNKLERIEEKEYAYMADGNYDEREQDDIWEDVAWLNRRVGLELSDYDRTYYGFNRVYFGYNSYPFWYNRYYGNGWDFYRFDNLGWGSYRYGYMPRYYYPRTNVYVFNNERYIYKNGQRYQNSNVNNNGGSRNATARVDNRANDNVVRRERTNPSARVGNTPSSARTSSRTTSPNGRVGSATTTRPSTRTASPNSRSYTPSANREVNRSGNSNGSMRAGSSSSSRSNSTVRPGSSSRSSETTRTAPSRSTTRSSAPRPSSSNRSSSSTRTAPSRSSSPSVSRPSSSSRSSSASRSSSPSRSSGSSSSSRGGRSSRN